MYILDTGGGGISTPARANVFFYQGKTRNARGKAQGKNIGKSLLIGINCINDVPAFGSFSLHKVW